LSGHGLVDLKGYDAYMSGQLHDHEFPQAQLEENLKALEGFPTVETVKS
jgi:tryptophan synthase beta chain